MNLQYGCIPFDDMPLCTSLIGQNPRYWDLIESLDVTGRNQEMLARRVKNNVERHGILYSPVADLQDLGDVNDLISAHNRQLYYKHREGCGLELDKGHVFMRQYEEDTVAIVKKLQEFARLAPLMPVAPSHSRSRWEDERATRDSATALSPTSVM